MIHIKDFLEISSATPSEGDSSGVNSNIENNLIAFEDFAKGEKVCRIQIAQLVEKLISMPENIKIPKNSEGQSDYNDSYEKVAEKILPIL